MAIFNNNHHGVKIKIYNSSIMIIPVRKIERRDIHIHCDL